MGGYYTVVGFSDEIPVPALDADASGISVQIMIQACAAHLEAAIRTHTEDWHMMQKLWLADLDQTRLAASDAAGGRPDAGRQ